MKLHAHKSKIDSIFFQPTLTQLKRIIGLAYMIQSLRETLCSHGAKLHNLPSKLLYVCYAVVGMHVETCLLLSLVSTLNIFLLQSLPAADRFRPFGTRQYSAGIVKITSTNLNLEPLKFS